MKIAICGGGNIAHALAGMLGQLQNIDLYVLTRKPDAWSKQIKVNLEGNLFFSNPGKVTSSTKEAITGANIVILSLPAFARKEITEKIAPYISQNTWIGAFPGMGNFDLVVNEVFKHQTEKPKIFASQRVPYICRTIEYGKEIHITSKKSEIFVAALNHNLTNEICTLLSPLLQMPVLHLHNFLEITLSTSNPILHPARTYSLFKAYQQSMFWNQNILFYETWNQEASEILINMDNEVHRLIHSIPLNLNGIVPLLKHYGVPNTTALTQKISYIEAFKGILSPMKQTNNAWVPDFESRYFTEDISYGLIIIKSLCQLFGIETPQIDTVIDWAQKNMNRKFIFQNHLLVNEITDIPLHVHYGIDSPEKLVSYYLSD